MTKHPDGGATAFALLRATHARLRALFDRYEEIAPRNHRDRASTLEAIRDEIEAHRRLDEDVLYPAARKSGVVTEAGDGYPILERLLAELHDLGAGDRRFDLVFSVLRENVEHHIREEEDDILRELDRDLSAGAKDSLRRALEDHGFARCSAR